MNVKDVMTREVRSVRMADRLDAAARLMWEQDCGFAPVVDSSHVLVGVLTDRDLCMATYTQGRPLSEIPVTAVMARMLRTIDPDDTLASALAVLQQAQLHRLPVVDARGVLVGLLAVNDLVRLAASRSGALEATAVVKCLAAIGASRRAPASLAPLASASATAKPTPVGTPLAPGAGKPVKVVAAASSSPSPAPSAQSSVPMTPAAVAPVVVPVAGKVAAKAAKGNKSGKGRKG